MRAEALSRRALLAASLGLAACNRGAVAQTAAPASLKSLAPAPVGACVMTDHLDDPHWVDLAVTHFSQLTPEWEMKMEYILSAAGDYRWDAPDRIAGFAAQRGMRLHGHALIWYSQAGPYFRGLDGPAFARAYDRYIATVAGRYRGRVAGWDVVNEAVAEDGDGLRDCLWSERLGQDGYIIRAFEQAKAADPEAVLFLNDYNLENNPAKGATFLRLVERLLKAGAPIGGLGTQSHLDIDIPAGRIATFIGELGRFDLPVHVSELDASLRGDGPFDVGSRGRRLARQTARVSELAAAFMALPPARRYAFTVWGVRDPDSWLRRGEHDDGRDSPLLFDAAGKANPMFEALASAVA